MNGDCNLSTESTLSTPSNEITLRARAREAILAGLLPGRPADRTWGGPGSGADCTICSAPVKQDEAEIEIEFARSDRAPGGDKYRVHARCFAVWEFEVDQMQSTPPAATNGGLPASKPEAMMKNGHALPARANGRKIPGRGRNKTYKRGPA